MPTIKDVIYKTIKHHSAPLSAFYQEYRIENNNGIKGYKEQEIFEQEFDFWTEELKLLNISDKEKMNIIYDMRRSIRLGQFIYWFESKLLPILLVHWKFT